MNSTNFRPKQTPKTPNQKAGANDQSQGRFSSSGVRASNGKPTPAEYRSAASRNTPNGVILRRSIELEGHIRQNTTSVASSNLASPTIQLAFLAWIQCSKLGILPTCLIVSCLNEKQGTHPRTAILCLLSHVRCCCWGVLCAEFRCSALRATRRPEVFRD